MQVNRFLANRRAFTLLEIMIVVAILGILVAVAFPNYLKTRLAARKQLCIENLSQIDSAKQIWGVENGKKNGDVPTTDDLIGPASYIKRLPICAAGGTYDFQPIGTPPSCEVEGHSLVP